MPNKNRSARYQDFRHGVTMYEASSEGVCPVFILSRPFVKPRDPNHRVLFSKILSIDNSLYTSTMFLSDMAVQGHAYDSRPPRLHMSAAAAERAVQLHKEWAEFKSKQRAERAHDFDTFEYMYADSDPALDHVNEFKCVIKKLANLEYSTMFLHDIQRRWASDNKSIRFAIKDPTEENCYLQVFGYSFDSTHVRVTAYSAFVEAPDAALTETPYMHDMFLMREKGVWYNVSSTMVWLGDAKFTKDSGVELAPEWQTALNGKITVLND